jgi:NAD(P)-dependent dehydrogenase (short-subunit alcohol dehydrogenase family)
MPEEVAKAIVFLTSDKSETMTGHTLTVTGGRHIAPIGFRDWYGSEKMD